MATTTGIQAHGPGYPKLRRLGFTSAGGPGGRSYYEVNIIGFGVYMGRGTILEVPIIRNVVFGSSILEVPRIKNVVF